MLEETLVISYIFDSAKIKFVSWDDIDHLKFYFFMTAETIV